MRRVFEVVLLVGITVALAASARAQAPAATPAAPCEAQLNDAKAQNGTIVQLWRDISNQRGSYEIQIASIRSVLGQECPENQSVSQCVATLHTRYMDTAQKLVKATEPAKPKAAEAKK